MFEKLKKYFIERNNLTIHSIVPIQMEIINKDKSATLIKTKWFAIVINYDTVPNDHGNVYLYFYNKNFIKVIAYNADNIDRKKCSPSMWQYQKVELFLDDIGRFDSYMSFELMENEDGGVFNSTLWSNINYDNLTDSYYTDPNIKYFTQYFLETLLNLFFNKIIAGEFDEHYIDYRGKSLLDGSQHMTDINMVSIYNNMKCIFAHNVDDIRNLFSELIKSIWDYYRYFNMNFLRVDGDKEFKGYEIYKSYDTIGISAEKNSGIFIAIKFINGIGFELSIEDKNRVSILKLTLQLDKFDYEKIRELALKYAYLIHSLQIIVDYMKNSYDNINANFINSTMNLLPHC
jgi:hypothetical protein